jgi:flagellar protein FlgJ
MYLDDYRSGGSRTGLANAADSVEDFAAALKKAASGKAASGRADDGKSAAQGGTGGSNSVTIDKNDKLYEQCLELETFLVKTLLNSMRNTVQKSDLLDEGFAGKMYEDMLYDEYAKDYTRNAGFGLAKQVYLELTGQRGSTLIRS